MVGKTEYEHKIDKKEKVDEKDKERLMNTPHKICMLGNTSTSESFRIALQFANSDDPNKQIVLFVTVLANYIRFSGFRMNQPEYSAHPEEMEILMCEGAKVVVMGVEDILINNETGDMFWKPFNGKTLTIIYLYHP